MKAVAEDVGMLNPVAPIASVSRSIEVLGPLDRTLFPEMCLRCGEPAHRTLPISKLFYRRAVEHSPYNNLIRGIKAPICEGCLQEHQRELPPIPTDIKNRLLRSWFWKSLPFFFPLGVSTWFVTILIPILQKALADSHDSSTHWINIGITSALVAFFGLLVLAFVGLIRRGGEYLIHEPIGNSYVQIESGPLGSRFVLPVKPTSFMQSINFTGERQELFDAERHQFTFENAEVAARFAALNANRKWNPNALGPRLAAVGRWILIGAILLFGVYSMLFHPASH